MRARLARNNWPFRANDRFRFKRAVKQGRNLAVLHPLRAGAVWHPFRRERRCMQRYGSFLMRHKTGRKEAAVSSDRISNTYVAVLWRNARKNRMIVFNVLTFVRWNNFENELI